VRFEILMALTIMITIFWDVMPCSLVEVYTHSWGTCCPPIQGRTVTSPEEGENTFLWEVGKLLPDYPGSHFKRQYFSIFFAFPLFCPTNKVWNFPKRFSWKSHQWSIYENLSYPADQPMIF
jgi:hypothetical protein